MPKMKPSSSAKILAAASPVRQRNGRTPEIPQEYRGLRQSEIAKKIGISYNTLHARIAVYGLAKAIAMGLPKCKTRTHLFNGQMMTLKEIWYELGRPNTYEGFLSRVNKKGIDSAIERGRLVVASRQGEYTTDHKKDQASNYYSPAAVLARLDKLTPATKQPAGIKQLVGYQEVP